MLKVIEYVEEKVSCTLPVSFALIIDGWTIGSLYMVAVLSFYYTKSETGYDQVLPSFITFEVEASHTAEEHLRYMNYVLSFYNKSRDNIVVIVGNNCAVNVSLAPNITCYFIHCARHRINLAINDIHSSNMEFFRKIQAIVKKINYRLLTARISQITS